MISIADIPFKLFNFRGFISDLIIDNMEFKFATYNNARLLNYKITEDLLDITLQKSDYFFNVKSKCKNGLKLFAPVKGKMEKGIYESISASIEVTLKKGNTIIFCDTSTDCGLEIVAKR